MEDSKIIPVSNTRHTTDQTSLAEETGANVACSGDAAQVTAVEGVEGQASSREDESGDEVFRGGEELRGGGV